MGIVFTSRREFLTLAAAAPLPAARPRPAVSIVRIVNDRVSYAVDQALDLLGGAATVTRGKDRLLLKPNLVSASRTFTTKPEVVRALAEALQRAKKEVSIGEGSAAAPGFNVEGAEILRTRKRELIDRMQQSVFDSLGYTELAKTLRAPLVNLHSGRLTEVKVPDAFVFDRLTLHSALTETDMLVSVPMMKTHGLAQVTLGLKNVVGLFPGTVYEAPRCTMHNAGAKVEPSGTAAVVIDMVRANRMGLTVIDGWSAMEGNGPSNGTLTPMNVIIAGTDPLATDIVAAAAMGFDAAEVPTFMYAHRAGMVPRSLADIEIRGEKVAAVRREFVRPQVRPWLEVAKVWAVREI